MTESATSNPIGPFRARFGRKQVEVPARDQKHEDEVADSARLTGKLLQVPRSDLDEQRFLPPSPAPFQNRSEFPASMFLARRQSTTLGRGCKLSSGSGSLAHRECHPRLRD